MITYDKPIEGNFIDEIIQDQFMLLNDYSFDIKWDKINT